MKKTNAKKMKPLTIKTRSGRETDLRFVCDLSRRNMEEYTKKIWGGWDNKRFKASLDKKRLTIICRNNRRVGFFDIELHDGVAYLHNIQLSRIVQGRGLGKQMMLMMEWKAKKADVKKLEAKVFSDNPAKKFYQKIGYAIIKEENGVTLIRKKL